MTIGKHTIEFRDEVRPVAAPYGTLETAVGGQPRKAPPQLDRTMVLDTAKAKEMLAQAAAAAAAPGPVAVQRLGITQGQRPVNTTLPVRQTIGTLTIVKGRTDKQRYVLTGTLTMIGKSRMAGIRL